MNLDSFLRMAILFKGNQDAQEREDAQTGIETCTQNIKTIRITPSHQNSVSNQHHNQNCQSLIINTTTHSNRRTTCSARATLSNNTLHSNRFTTEPSTNRTKTKHTAKVVVSSPRPSKPRHR